MESPTAMMNNSANDIAIPPENNIAVFYDMSKKMSSKTGKSPKSNIVK
jgi:hypothetical protein